MGVGRLREKEGARLGPRVPSTRATSAGRRARLGARHPVERFPPLRRPSGTLGSRGSRPHPLLIRGAPGSLADSLLLWLCVRRARKCATSNKSLCLGSHQDSGWPSPSVPGPKRGMNVLGRNARVLRTRETRVESAKGPV
ncbi:hypothetical protein NN561_010244 [Cricetulus griseus]